jgi:hypothetical protein
LVLVINMYLLGVSVFTSIVESVQVIAILGVLTVLYVAFICYLILEPAQADGNWACIKNFFSRYCSLSFSLKETARNLTSTE